MYLLELKSNFLYSLFNFQKINTFKIDDIPAIYIQSGKNIEKINLKNVTSIKVEKGYIFSSVIIITDDNIIWKIPYVFIKNRKEKINKLLTIVRAYALIKSLDFKIVNKFKAKEYLSYRDNLLFYKNIISKNKKLFIFKDYFKEMFKDFDFSKNFKNLVIYSKNSELVRLKNNEKFMQKEPQRAEKFLKGLNEKQIEAVITNEDNVMVVAGAGSGKTKVIENKVNYLVNKLHVEPSEILVLAFNKDAVSELRERIISLPENNIRTFHSLGNKIIGLDKDKRLIDFSNSQDKYQDFIKAILINLLLDNSLYNLLFLYFHSFFYNSKDPYNFDSQGEYNNFIKENKIISLKADEVKSFGEVDIANFLYMHDIPYEYEAEYKGEYERTFDFGIYRPDFYIPKNEQHEDIYIEFFGIDRNGKTPKYINEEKYKKSIVWKRAVHKKNNTILIELYSYNRFEGKLLQKLKSKLKKYHVDCSKLLSSEERFKILNQVNGIDNFTKLLSIFLINYKANKHSYILLWNNLMLELKRIYNEIELIFEDVDNQNQINRLYYEINLIKRKQAFLKIFKPVYEQYEALLKNNNKYDFSDMIVAASEKIYKCYEENRFNYKYVIVDEFQDISLGRADFIKKIIAMRKDSKLFVVGDDWQAINRFAGSYLSIMTNFKKEFSENKTRKSKIIKLNRTYRFNDNINDVSSKFIQENPNQIKKDIIAYHSDEPSVIIWWDEDQVNALNNIIENLIFTELEKHKNEYIPSVLILGRYNLKSSNEKQTELSKMIKYLQEEYKDILDIEYMTIHKSKGLGRDYVIILDLQEGAFPSVKSDDSILEMVMSEKDNFPNAEERRLFYVALTRAKKKVYLYSNLHPSSFLNELLEPENHYNVFEYNRPDNYALQKCPFCNLGVMVKPLSENDKFFYCQNKLCKQKAPVCSICNKGFLYEDSKIGKIICSNEDCGYIAEKCPDCGGILLYRNGEFGPFIGCSNYNGKDKDLSCLNKKQAEQCRTCRKPEAFVYETYNCKSKKFEKHCSNKDCKLNKK